MLRTESGNSIHDADFQLEATQAIVKDITETFSSVPGLVWGSAPWYSMKQTPKQYRDTMPLGVLSLVHAQTKFLAKDARVPFLDFYRATQACVWANCTKDGAHRARFVNRAKAQMFLEVVCSEPPKPLCDGRSP